MRQQDILHSAFEIPHKALKSVETLALLPPKLARPVFLYAKRVVADSTELVFPKKTHEEFVRELAGEHLLEKASKALVEIDIGEQIDDSKTIFEGRAALAEVVIEAGTSEAVPWEVTDQLIEKAAEVEVNPEYEPELEDPTQDAYKEVLKKHDVVKDMSTYRENEL